MSWHRAEAQMVLVMMVFSPISLFTTTGSPGLRTLPGTQVPTDLEDDLLSRPEGGLFPELPPTQAAWLHPPGREKGFMPELKGLVTKSCDILRFKDRCVVNPLSVTGNVLTSWERGILSPAEFQSHTSLMGIQGGNLQLGGALLGSGWRSPLSQVCNYRDAINTHPGDSQVHSGEGNLDVKLVEAVSHGDLDINIDEIPFVVTGQWGLRYFGYRDTETISTICIFLGFSPRFSNLTVYYHIHEKPENGSRLKLCLWDAYLVENPIHHLTLLFPANDKQLA